MRHPLYFEPHHAAVDAAAHRLASQAVEPLEAGWLGADPSFEEEDRRARQLVGILAEGGLLAHAVPQAGAAGMDGRALCLARERLAFASGLADFAFAMQGLGSHPIALAGDDAQVRWLAEARAGRAVAAFALTEPGAGSDVAALSTTARRDGGEYVMDGHKRFISNAGLADFYCLFARTGAGRGGISAFVVPGERAGLTVRRQRVMAPHPLGELILDGCRVPAASRLGAEGEGWALAFTTLERFRPSVGAAALGLGQRALQEALAHARRRIQFGRPLSQQQAIQLKLAAMATELEGARLLVYQAARLKDVGQPDTLKEAAMAKLSATEAAGRAVDQAVQILGGEGVVAGSVVERLYREIRPLRIYEGTSEIQHLIIARALLSDPPGEEG